ncbi:hypothetical protein CEQ90_13580 [Lewinellaceae bacterium SD302]|nr:hypothetical protein CEQ90_13580 [Lewinellaceae bacterium SD302]
MRRIILSLLGVFLLCTSLSACDACGCGVGGGGFGLLGLYRSNFIGLQYGYAGFRSYYSSGEATGTEDAFHTTTLSARFSPLDRFRVQVSQSYHANRRTGEVGDQQLDGFGDLRIGAVYTLLNDRIVLKDQLLYLEAGFDLFLPTGRYVADPLEDYFLPDNFSPGRGAVAYSPNFLVALSGQRMGFSFSGELKIHGKTEGDYRFGTESRLAAQAFSELLLGKQSNWVPFVGLQFDHITANRSRSGNDVHATGGKALLGRAGVQFRFPRFTCGSTLLIPLADDYANGEVRSGLRLSADVYYQF